MYYIYAISSIERNYIYVCLTNNLMQRIDRHNKGGDKTTKLYLPLNLIFVEEIDGLRSVAREKEKYWISGIGKEKLKTLKNNCITLGLI